MIKSYGYIKKAIYESMTIENSPLMIWKKEREQKDTSDCWVFFSRFCHVAVQNYLTLLSDNYAIHLKQTLISSLFSIKNINFLMLQWKQNNFMYVIQNKEWNELNGLQTYHIESKNNSHLTFVWT